MNKQIADGTSFLRCATGLAAMIKAGAGSMQGKCAIPYSWCGVLDLKVVNPSPSSLGSGAVSCGEFIWSLGCIVSS